MKSSIKPKEKPSLSNILKESTIIIVGIFIFLLFLFSIIYGKDTISAYKVINGKIIDSSTILNTSDFRIVEYMIKIKNDTIRLEIYHSEPIPYQTQGGKYIYANCKDGSKYLNHQRILWFTKDKLISKYSF